MARYAMCVNLTTCVACDACVIACKMENKVPDGYSRCWTEEIVTDLYPNLKADLYSSRCQHCENAPCVTACPTEASYIKDGLVLVKKDLCVGCEHCISACPYGARYLHPDKYVDKCTYCDHRLETKREPACVEICPTESLVFGDLDDPKSKISRLLKKRKYRVLKSLKGTVPKYFLLKSIVVRKELTDDSEER